MSKCADGFEVPAVGPCPSCGAENGERCFGKERRLLIAAAGATQQGLERILAAVGVTQVLAGIDKAELLSDLEGIQSLFVTSVDFRRKPAKQKQRTDKIIEKAKGLKGLIRSDIRYRRHIHALDRLIKDVSQERPERLMDLLDMERGVSVSAFENLVRMLCMTYERHFFPDKANYKRELVDGPDDVIERVVSPFIDFAEATMKELGITTYSDKPYSRRAIADALSKIRRVGRARQLSR